MTRFLVHRQAFVATVIGATLAGSGCRRAATADNAQDIKVDFAFQSNPPGVGRAPATVRLTTPDGKPVEGCRLKLEGNMNHAGMTPVFADAVETKPGQYNATLELTMGGDWFVLINGTLADGRKLTRKVDVPGVKSE